MTNTDPRAAHKAHVSTQKQSYGYTGVGDIAKLIRADIKAAKKAGDLPKTLKVSVRSESFSGGSAIRMNITKAPFRCLNAAQVAFIAEHPTDWHRDQYHWELPERWTDECQAALKLLKKFHAKYNWNDSDSMTDHFDVNYYGQVEVGHELERDERKAIETELAQAEGPDPRVTDLLKVG